MNEQQILEIAYRAKAEPIYHDPRFPPSLYYRFLKLLVIELQAVLSVELGVCGGGGSLHMALPGIGHVVGVDIAEDHKENTDYIKEICPNFTFLIGDSVGNAAFVRDTFGLVDVLFIDTTHTYEQTMAEYRAYEPYLSDRAVVCLDDLRRPGMDRAWAEMPQSKLRIDWLHGGAGPQGGGFGVVWK